MSSQDREIKQIYYQKEFAPHCRQESFGESGIKDQQQPGLLDSLKMNQLNKMSIWAKGVNILSLNQMWNQRERVKEDRNAVRW